MSVISLSTQNLRKVYRGRAVVNDVSIGVAQGEVVGLLGPNGAGKTTTFYMVVGLTPPDRGEVVLGDTDIMIALGKSFRSGWLSQRTSCRKG